MADVDHKPETLAPVALGGNLVFAHRFNGASGAATDTNTATIRVWRDIASTALVSGAALTQVETGIYRFKNSILAASGFTAGQQYTILVHGENAAEPADRYAIKVFEVY